MDKSPKNCSTSALLAHKCTQSRICSDGRLIKWLKPTLRKWFLLSSMGSITIPTCMLKKSKLLMNLGRMKAHSTKACVRDVKKLNLNQYATNVAVSGLLYANSAHKLFTSMEHLLNIRYSNFFKFFRSCLLTRRAKHNHNKTSSRMTSLRTISYVENMQMLSMKDIVLLVIN